MFDPRATKPVEVRFPASGVFVLESRHTRGFEMEPVKNPYLKIVQPFSGAGWLVRRNARVPIRPGDVIVVPAGETHHLEDDGARPLGIYVLCISKRALATHGGENMPSQFRRFPAPVWSNDFRALIRHLLHEQSLARPGTDLLSAGLALQALGLIIRAMESPGRSDVAERVAQPARARVAAYAEEMTRTFYRRQHVDDAAAALGLSRRRFTQLFREITGESWLTALRHHRIEHAKKLLAETSRSIASIGYECGFEDITTFYRVFKAAEHASPLAWRNSNSDIPSS